MLSPSIQSEALAGRLTEAGIRGAAKLGPLLRSLMEATPARIEERHVAASIVCHSQALVWHAISTSVPVEVGRPLMELHIQYVAENLEIERYHLDAKLLRSNVEWIWLRYAEKRDSAGGPLWGMASTILENHLSEPPRGMKAVPEILAVIAQVTADVRATVKSTGDVQKQVEHPVYDARILFGDSDGESPASPEPDLPEFELPAAEPNGSPPAQGSFERRGNDEQNGIARVGLVLGLISTVAFFLGAIPIAAIICSSVGLTRAKERGGKGKVPSIIGLVLGLLYFGMHVLGRINAGMSG